MTQNGIECLNQSMIEHNNTIYSIQVVKDFQDISSINQIVLKFEFKIVAIIVSIFSIFDYFQDSTEVKIITLSIFSGMIFLHGFFFSHKLKEDLIEEARIANTVTNVQFYYCLALCFHLTFAFMLAMAALDEIYDDYHYFLCGVCTLYCIFLIQCTIKIISGKEKLLWALSAIVLFFMLLSVLYFYMIVKLNRIYEYPQDLASIILMDLFNILVIPTYVLFLFGSIFSLILRSKQLNLTPFIILLVVSIPTYVLIVLTVRIYVEEVNIQLFNLVFYVPFSLYFIQNLINRRFVILLKNIERFLIINQSVLQKMPSNRLLSCFRVSEIKCGSCAQREASVFTKCDEELHLSYCLQCFKEKVVNEKNRTCPKCSNKFDIAKQVSPVKYLSQFPEKLIGYYIVLKKYKIIHKLQ